LDKKPVIKSAHKTIVDQIKEESKKPAETLTPRVEFLTTGSTLLNLALSQKGRDGGVARGRIINIVGDGSSGKSLICLEICAHAFYKIKEIKSEIYPQVKNVQIVYNNQEGVMDFPLEQMYGQDFVDGIEWIQTDTCQAFGIDYQKRVRALKPGDFLLYVIDSLDATISQEAKERMAKTLEDKKPDASYGMEKAKFFSQDFFAHLCGAMEGKDATLLCISQVRENIGVSFGEKYRRVGGKALDFFTHQVPWIATIEKLKKTFRSQERVYGVRGKARIKRNKTAKPFREAEFTILFDYGLDDLGGMIDYLYGPKVKVINWNGAEFKRNEFIEMIESNPANMDKLIEMVETDWAEIEAAVVPERKKRW
jgi:recombination protein RecA